MVQVFQDKLAVRRFTRSLQFRIPNPESRVPSLVWSWRALAWSYITRCYNCTVNEPPLAVAWNFRRQPVTRNYRSFSVSHATPFPFPSPFPFPFFPLFLALPFVIEARAKRISIRPRRGGRCNLFAARATSSTDRRLKEEIGKAFLVTKFSR